MNKNLNVTIRRLTKSDNRSEFKSGNIELDYYFHRFAGQNQFRHHIGTTYIAIIENQITGYITVSSGELNSESVSKALQKKLPAYPIPVLRISRLAVDTRFQKQGIGKLLLRSMLELAIDVREKIGCVGIVVDAKQEAVPFYLELGFIPLKISKGALHAHLETTALLLNLNLVIKAQK